MATRALNWAVASWMLLNLIAAAKGGKMMLTPLFAVLPEKPWGIGDERQDQIGG